jgi:hypothetical protein
MSAYQQGYDQGYDDAINGERNKIEAASDASFGLIDVIGNLIDTDDVEDYEQGYKDGYEAGQEELSEE